MKAGVKLSFLLLAFGLVLSSPVNKKEKDLLSHSDKQDIEAQGILRTPEIVESNHIAKSDSNSGEDVDSPCSDYIEDSNNQERISLLQSLQNQQMNYLRPAYVTPVQNYPGYPAASYGFQRYNGMYPFIHPRFLAAYGAGYMTRNALPPVLSTYIHGLMPQDEVQKSAYNIDVLNENAGYLPTVVRSARTLRDAEEDWLAELRHDAIMNNIIPTMPVSMARFAALAPAPAPVPPPAIPIPVAVSAPVAYQAPAYGPGAVRALFLAAPKGGCAQPLLFSCTPKITHGSLINYPSPHAAASVVYHGAPLYRHEDEHEHSIGEHDSHSVPDKITSEEKATHVS